MALLTEKAFISKEYLKSHIARQEMTNYGFRKKFLDSRIFSSSDGAGFLRQGGHRCRSLINSSHLQQWFYGQ
jgi:hypothetical protein